MEDYRKRYALNFDLEQKMLRQYLDEKNPEKAYRLLRGFLEKKGFFHVQGSGYNSIEEMSESEIFKIMLDLDETFEWFGRAVKSIQVTEIGERYDYTEQFKDVVEEDRSPAKSDDLAGSKNDSLEKCMKRTAERFPKRGFDKGWDR